MPTWPTYVMAGAPLAIGSAIGFSHARWRRAALDLNALRGKWLIFAAALLRILPDDWPALGPAGTVRARVILQVVVMGVFLWMNWPALASPARVAGALAGRATGRRDNPRAPHAGRPSRAEVIRMSKLTAFKAMATSALLVGATWVAIAAPFVGGH